MPAVDPLVLQLDASIRDGVAKMIADAQQKYHVAVRVNQTKRSAAQAQTFHVLHMYLYNYFPNRKPRVVAADGRTIKWEHLSDPNVRWALIDDLKRQFLLTAAGLPAALKDELTGRKAWVVPPDKVASTRAMADYLKKHGVASMAAPGVDGCGEPCGCGGHASKHITGKAVDLSGLDRLGQAILAADKSLGTVEDAVDHFLAGYHLCRPLAHLKGKARELWHVEAMPPHVPKPAPAKPAHPAAHKTHHTTHHTKHHRHLTKHHHGC